MTRSLLFWIALSFIPGLFGGRLKPGEWYQSLPRPPWTPPNLAFPTVWTLLYAAMGTAAWLVFRGGVGEHRRALILFIVQLVLNGLWSWIFFGRHQIGWALVNLIALWVAVAVLAVTFWKISPVAGGLMAVYLAWLSIAISLNGYIYARMA